VEEEIASADQNGCGDEKQIPFGNDRQEKQDQRPANVSRQIAGFQKDRFSDENDRKKSKDEAQSRIASVTYQEVLSPDGS
jgi:hypothetical protein